MLRQIDFSAAAPIDRGILAQRGWLAGTSEAFRSCILEQGRWRDVPAGGVIALEGDTDAVIFGIASGVVNAQRSHRHDIPILGSLLFPGQWFGSGPRLAGVPRMMTFTARQDVTLLCLGDAELARVRAQCPDLADHLARLAQLQANFAVDCVSELLIPETELRITAVLLRLAHLAAPETSLPITQTDLAEMANASRASVGMVFKQLKQHGLIAISYGRITVCDRAALIAWFDSHMAAQ